VDHFDVTPNHFAKAAERPAHLPGPLGGQFTTAWSLAETTVGLTVRLLAWQGRKAPAGVAGLSIVTNAVALIRAAKPRQRAAEQALCKRRCAGASQSEKRACPGSFAQPRPPLRGRFFLAGVNSRRTEAVAGRLCFFLALPSNPAVISAKDR
jgi:hypothetical protein